MFTGHETTAVVLIYMCYVLSRPANWYRQRRLRNELRQAFGTLGPLDPKIDDFEALYDSPT